MLLGGSLEEGIHQRRSGTTGIDTPMGMRRWFKRTECDPLAWMTRWFRWGRSTSRSGGALDELGIESRSLTVCRRGEDSKRSRS